MEPIKYIFKAESEGIFAEETKSDVDFSMPSRHFHNSLELYFLLEGERYYFIEQDTWHILAQTAVLISENQIHKTSSVSSCPHYHRFLLQLDTNLMDQALILKNVSSLHVLGENYRGAAQFSDDTWNDTLVTISLLKNELSKNIRERCQPICNMLALQLILQFVRCRKNSDNMLLSDKNPDLKVRTGMYQKVHEIALYLQNHSSEPCSLEQIAGHFYISTPYLTRIFKTVTGFTVNEYLTHCRIRKASLLLRESNMSITEIAAQTGFGNITYFERVFKNIAGTSPLQYRKQAPNAATGFPENI